jgi:hypothetical protein
VIVAVDLGLTNSAACSSIRFDGTVIGRKFINQPLEKDRLKTKVNKRIAVFKTTDAPTIIFDLVGEVHIDYIEWRFAKIRQRGR